MSTMDEIAEERQKISERLARLDAEREKLSEQLNELEVAERVLSRFGGKPQPAGRRRRGRPLGAAAPTPPQRKTRGAPAPRPSSVSLSDATLQAVKSHPQGISQQEVLQHLQREFGLTVRPNHLGIALQRHRRAGRLDQRDSLWYPPASAGAEHERASA